MKSMKKEQLPEGKPIWTRFPIRTRPHCNPLADEGFEYPIRPQDLKLSEMYPKYFDENNRPLVEGADIKVLDIGCAYGGYLSALTPYYKQLCEQRGLPPKLLLGMEIRDKVADFTQGRIRKLREGKEPDPHMPFEEHRQAALADPASFERLWAVRNNAMKYLPNYFRKGQLDKITIMFPDPNVARRQERRRIIQPTLLHEYAYVLRQGGLLYTISDVEDTAKWMQAYLDASPLFERVPDEVLEQDPEDALVLKLIRKVSEDAQRTAEKGLGMHWAVFRKK